MMSERVILHSDCNNFYASVECVYDPALRQVPFAVCGDPELRHGIVLAKNDKAKAYGVTTGEAIWQARRKCPGLRVVPPSHDRYMRYTRLTRAMYAEYSDRVEPFGLDESWLDITGGRFGGEETAHRLRERVRDELGITVSVGVSFNKVFAKLGSDMKKPDAVTVISKDNYKERVWPLPASDLLYIGRRTQQKLFARGLLTIGDVARADPTMMKAVFGIGGEQMRAYANGEDPSPVCHLGEGEPVKSIGNSTTTPYDIRTMDEARAVLFLLADSVAERMRAHRVKGGTVVLHMRTNTLVSCERQVKLPRFTQLSGEIAQTAIELLGVHCDFSVPLRTLGVRVTSLEPETLPEQLCFMDDPARERHVALARTLDSIARVHGQGAVTRAVTLTLGVQPEDMPQSATKREPPAASASKHDDAQACVMVS